MHSLFTKLRHWLGIALSIWVAGFTSLACATETLVADPTLGGGLREYNLVARDGIWRAIKTQADGKIVLAGYVEGYQISTAKRAFALQRLNADGSLDRTFAPNSATPGTIAVGIGADPWETGGISTGLTLAIDSAGNYVVGGTQEGTDAQLAFARIKPDGSRDTTLNPQGALPGTFMKNLGSGREALHAMVIDAQGRYVISGYVAENGLSKAFVGRLLPTGAFDTTFNASGSQPGIISFFVPTHLQSSNTDSTSAAVYALNLDNSGRIVFGGGTGTYFTIAIADPALGSNNGDSFVGRLNTDGTFDSSFAVGSTLPGIKILSSSHSTNFNDVGRIAIDSQGRILYGDVDGTPSYNTSNGGSWSIKSFRIHRLNANGSIDTSFGGQTESAPSVTFNIPNEFAFGGLMALEPVTGDQILVAGTVWYAEGNLPGGGESMFVTRLSAAGSVLSAFGNSGPGGAPGFRAINNQGVPSNANGTYYKTLAGSATLTNGKLLLLSPVRQSVPQYRAVYAVSADTGGDDAAFGNAGQVALSGVDNQYESPRKLFQRTGGGFFIAGDANASGTGGHTLRLARTDATGALDTSWQANALKPGVLLWSGRDDMGLFNVSNVTELPDGKILVAGNTRDTSTSPFQGGWTVLRLLPDGSTDTSYGNGLNYPGTFFYKNGTRGEGAFPTSFDSSGRAIIAGTTDVGGVSRVIVFRVTADGKLDNTFGDGVNPYIVESFGDNASAASPTKVIVGADGKITVVGTSNQHAAVARYLNDGSLDTSFNPSGTRPGSVIFASGGSADDVIIDHSGRLVMTSNEYLFTAKLRRVLSNGSIDMSFGTAGIVSGCTCGYFNKVVEASDGSLYAITGGTLGNFGTYSPTVIKFTSSGVVDQGFANLGQYPLTQNQYVDYLAAYDMQFDAQGRLLVLAQSHNECQVCAYTQRQNTLLYRFNRAVSLTVPGAPTILSITPGPGRVTITLQPPSNTGGGPIVRYSTTCTASGHPNVTATSITTTIIVPGLVPGVSYACTATASNGSYPSPATPATSAIPKPRVDLTPILMLLLD